MKDELFWIIVLIIYFWWIPFFLISRLINWFSETIRDAKRYREIEPKLYSFNREREEFEKYKNRWQEILTQKEKELEIQKIEWQKKVDEDKKTIEQIAKEKSQGFPWLAQAYADYFYLQRLKEAEWLKLKPRSAKKAAEKVKEIACAKKEVEIKLRQAQYIIKYFLSLAPSLEEWIGEEDEELLKAILSREVDEPFFTLKAYWYSGQDPARRYLTKEEWAKLSRLDRLQLALERYWQPKNRFEAGIMYERYIGYLYETKGWGVYYSGITEGKADLGRDLIAKKENITKIIQCKRWTSPRFKIINEKHIFQLFGTAFQYKLEHPNENVKAALYTTTSVSETAKRFAVELSKIIQIEIKDNFPLKKYPLVKCNVSRKTGEKIYHLPFDQQYDRTIIEEERNECYVETVAEAESLGYRRAFRWRGGKE